MNNNNNHTDRFEELCAGYVLNALEPDERSEFEQMLAEADQEQRTVYYELRSTASQLAFTTQRAEPSAEVRQHLLDVINDEIQEQKVTPISESSNNWGKFGIAASFALLLVTLSLLFYAFNLSRTLENRNQKLAQTQQVVTELRSEIEQKNEMLAILESRQVDMVLMKGMEANPQGYGKVIWDADKQQALLQVSNLPAVPSDKEYQLWIIRNNTPVSAGLFAVNDPQRDSFFKIEQMAPADQQSTNAFAVTLEPKGGVPKPTGDMYLMGNTGN